jgi:predicted nucleic acid-binding Zn ribbon protein
MKCPNCGKFIPPRTKACKYCKTLIVRKSDKMAKKMAGNSLITMIGGGLLIFIAVILAIYDTLLFAGITASVGIVLLLIGKFMR